MLGIGDCFLFKFILVVTRAYVAKELFFVLLPGAMEVLRLIRDIHGEVRGGEGCGALPGPWSLGGRRAMSDRQDRQAGHLVELADQVDEVGHVLLLHLLRVDSLGQ